MFIFCLWMLSRFKCYKSRKWLNKNFQPSDFKPCLEAGGQARPGEPHSAATPEEELLSQAVVILSCASYRNQALHVFLRPALLAAAIHTASSNMKRKTDAAVYLFKGAALGLLKHYYIMWCINTNLASKGEKNSNYIVLLFTSLFGSYLFNGIWCLNKCILTSLF